MSLNKLRVYSNNIYNGFIERLVPKQKLSKTETKNRSENMGLKELLIKLEPFMVSFQSLLIWEKPYISAIAFSAFNCLFWLFMCLNRRLYSLIAIILFCINFYKLWSQYIWPEIRVPPIESTDTEGWIQLHPQVLSAPEISHYINELIVMFNASIRWFIDLRKTNHGFFCLLSSAFLLMTAFIGKLIPGVIIVYSLMMTLSLGPGIVLYVIPEGFYQMIGSILNSKTDQNDKKDDENLKEDLGESFDPQLNEQDLHELSLNSSQFNAFELNPFESDLRNDSSLQLLSESQLYSTLDNELGIKVTLNNDEEIKIFSSNSSNSGKSDSSHSNSSGIHFVSTHFSRNSSSENIEDDYELISDTEIEDSAKDSSHSRQTSV